MDTVKSVSLKEIPELVEQQKNAALHTPVYVFCTNAAKDSFTQISDQYCEIYQNNDLFSLNDPSSIDSVLASAVPRTLVFFLYKTGRKYWREWLDSAVKNAMMTVPNADLYAVEIKFADNDNLSKFGVTKLPCVLVYKMGHLVDKIFPENEEGIVHDEIAEYNNEIARMIQESEQSIQDYSKQGLKSDADKLEFEQRYREKEAQEKRKIIEAERKHMLEVRKKIEQDKLERQRKYGKK